MSLFKEFLFKRQLTAEFCKQAVVSEDGRKVTLAGYSAERDFASNFWQLYGKSLEVPAGVPVPPPCRLIYEAGTTSQRAAIKQLARCAANDFLKKM